MHGVHRRAGAWAERGPPLIGRERELALIAEFLDPQGLHARTLVLDGEPGIGKSALWNEAVGLAAERAWRVLSARAAQSDVRLTYVALGDLLGEVPVEALEEVPAPQRRALMAALLRSELDAPQEQRAVGAGVLSALTALSRDSPVLIAVDDAQWLDGASAALLEFVARRLGDLPVGLLLAQRTGEPEPFSFVRASARLARIELGPLSLGVLHQLIRDRTGVPLLRRRLVEIERWSGGNPLFALELARVVGERDDEPLTLPATLGEVVLARIRALPSPTREALLLTALAAAAPNIDLVDPSALAAAEEDGVVRIGADGAITFRHPLFAWAVVTSASTVARRAAHAELAARAEEAEVRARHLALASDAPNDELASLLDTAASAARARGAPASAAELLSHARRLTPPADAGAWARRAAEEIPLLLEGGDWEQAWALGQEALVRLPPGPLRAAVLLEAASFRPAPELCAQALAESGADPDLRVRAELQLSRQGIYEFDPDSSLMHVRKAVDVARALRDQVLLAAALTQLGVVEFLLGGVTPLPALDEALRLESALGRRVLPAGASASCYRALWLTFTDELESARAMLEDLLLQAVEAGDEASQTQLLSFLALVEMRAGRWPRARELIEASMSLADLMEFAQGSGEKRGILAMLQALEGELDAARATAAEGMAISTAIGDRFGLVVQLSALAFAALGTDDPAGCLEHVAHIRKLLPAGRDAPVWLDVEGDELEALVAVGKTADAKHLIASLERRGREQPVLRRRLWAGRGAALLLAGEGDVADALAVLEALLTEHHLEAAPFELARTLLLKGKLERRVRHKAAARTTLARAGALFDELGAAAWSAKANAEMSRLGLRRARDELSDTEQRVAALAAAGKTNREIAADLFISRRTVEANVARVYRKLGVNSRAALAGLLTRRGEAPERAAD